MSAVMNRVMEWLSGFEGVSDAQRVTPDILEDGDMSLSDLPEDSTLVYMDGTRDITAYALFRLRHGVKTHGERMEAQELLDTFEREVWQKNLRRELPENDATTQFQSVTVSQSPYMLETNGDEAVFQFGLEINYIDTTGRETA
ncbi:MAG: hypothetical protein MR742_11765 [Clostridiales bacterium]|nr:hypothetical protein [Clostridiales bacterium]